MNCKCFLNTSTILPNFSKAGQWFDYFSGDAISVTDTQVAIPLTPGEFHIYTTVKQPTPKAGLVTMLDNKRFSPTLFLYPNPAHGKVQLTIGSDLFDTLQLNFYDILGKSIDQRSVVYSGQPLEIDITKFQKGIYVLRVVGSKGVNTNTKLLIED